jgi:hypothetical protein
VQNITGLWGFFTNHQLGEQSTKMSHFSSCANFEEVMRIITVFDSISFSHIYREQNQLADRLSKEASQLEYGRWHINEQTTEGSFDYYHMPFHDGLL